MISRKILKKINSQKKIFIIGRGPSSRFFFPDNSKFSIGININKVNNSKLNFNYTKTKLIQENERIKVGSVYFFLYELLFYLDKKIKKKIDVYLYGFDFKKHSPDDDYEKKQVNKSKIQQEIDINSQIIAYQNIKNKFKKLKIFRGGFDIYSDFNPRFIINSNSLNSKSSKIEIVAEITTNHRGNTNILIGLIEGCIKAGVRIIKFQKRDVESFYTKNKLNSEYITPISKTFREYRNKLELTNYQLKIINKYQKKFKLKIIFSALDKKSFISLKKMGFKFFKIPSTISLHKNYINFMAKQKLSEIIISTGMTNERYLKYIISRFKKFKKLYLLHAVSAYPTYYKTINLNVLKYYIQLSKKYKNIKPGYSSHDIGNTGSMLAVAAGAKMIEKHVKIGVSQWMHYDDVAIDVNLELPQFVSDLNVVTNIMGTGQKRIYKEEFHKYKPVKKI
tara:strand:- start:1700 stop:3046 length:1347 start_codon:yes stop_codon:yes gene_type:complete